MRILDLHELRGQTHQDVHFLGQAIVDQLEVVYDLHATFDFNAPRATLLEPTQAF